MSHVITQGEYYDRAEQRQGYCRTCEAFTREDVHLQAARLRCPECEERTVVGVEYALERGDLEIEVLE